MEKTLISFRLKNILDDMGVSKLSSKVKKLVFLKVNCSFKVLMCNQNFEGLNPTWVSF